MSARANCRRIERSPPGALSTPNGQRPLARPRDFDLASLPRARWALSSTKGTFRISSACLALVLGFGLSLSANAANPGSTGQARVLEPIVLAPNADAANNPLASIWKDRLGELRRRLVNKSPAFFSASFDDGDARIVISVSVNDPACENLSGALGRPTTGSACPMRVALLKGGAVTLLAANEHFVLPISVDAAGAWSPPSPKNLATITFDPTSRSLRVSERIDGEIADAVNPNPIPLKY
jgi:hypothetical protein